MADIELRRVWVLHGQAEKADGLGRRIWDDLQARNLPKVRYDYRDVNMWWRTKSLEMAMVSELEGTVRGRVYIQPYGKALDVGRVITEPDEVNRFKWMAARAFMETIDHAIEVALGEDVKSREESGPSS